MPHCNFSHLLQLLQNLQQLNLRQVPRPPTHSLYVVRLWTYYAETTPPSGQARARQYRFAASPLSVNHRQEFDIIKIALYPLLFFSS